jgi:16S rRNA (cytidine1402-2'-O)-methyltransferase
MSGTLFIVATPIGNLQDFSTRAIDTLQNVDIVACEDTRTSSKLLNHFDINKKLIAYHEHNEQTQSDYLISLLQQGQNIALISDAGTPLISDPGFSLVNKCLQNNITVCPIPGSCALITALCASGISSSSFTFHGFLPHKMQAKSNFLQTLIDKSETLIFYESNHRLLETLEIMQNSMPNRQITLARELTKTFETIKKLSATDLYQFVKDDINQQKGECVLIVAGATEDKTQLSQATISTLKLLLEELPLKKAVNLTAQITGDAKNTIYQYALELKND